MTVRLFFYVQDHPSTIEYSFHMYQFPESVI